MLEFTPCYCIEHLNHYKKNFTQNYKIPEGLFQVESWLLHHGEKIAKSIPTFGIQTHESFIENYDILKTKINQKSLKGITSNIHLNQCGYRLFLRKRNQNSFSGSQKLQNNVHFITKSNPFTDTMLS